MRPNALDLTDCGYIAVFSLHYPSKVFQGNLEREKSGRGN